MPTRRQILTWLAALGLPLPARPLAAAQEAFPFAKGVIPLKPGEVFPKVAYRPSFLHPNGQWVMLSTNTGDQVMWDWRKGLPVAHWGGKDKVSRGDLPREPCSNDQIYPGCFAPGGQHWLYVTKGYDTWDVAWLTADGKSEVSSSGNAIYIQVDSHNPVLHVLENARAGSGLVLQRRDLSKALAMQAGPLTAGDPQRISYWSEYRTVALSADGRWMLRFHTTKPNDTKGWWAVWSLPSGPCRAFRAGSIADSQRPPVFSGDGRRAFIPTGKADYDSWNWSGQTSADEPWILLSSDQPPTSQSVLVDKGRLRLTRIGEARLEVRETQNDRLIRRLVGIMPHARLNAWGPSRDLAAIAQPGGVAYIWNRGAKDWKTGLNEITGEPLMRPPIALLADQTRALLWTRQGRRLVHGGETGKITVWDGGLLRYPQGGPKDEQGAGSAMWSRKPLEAPIRSLAWGGPWVAAMGCDGQVAVLESEQGAVRRIWKTHAHRANDVAASGDGAYLITAGLDGAALWKVEDGSLVRRFAQNRGEITAMAIHPKRDQKLLAVATIDGYVSVYEWESGRELWGAQLHSDVATSVAFHPDGATLWSLGWDHLGRVMQSTSGLPAQGDKRAATDRNKWGQVLWSWDGKSLLADGWEDMEPWPRGPLSGGINWEWDWECT